ncbi:EamA family transporter [Bacillus thuringiensis]|uniref:DMT family transporter n=1 Tax=Bacillus cereus group TaxID=86661 RepID=UPI000D042EAC|nr:MULTISPECIES: DMT family transporter [Bacillus cereus group]PRT10546.1 EamA family transporter [Bacillus thuringiensis]PRT25715.1 EamA family transporter [Bacillus thuringiensis]UPJ14498.1 DMT family transporter [Bacillus cereus]
MKQTILGAIYLSLAASIWGGMYVVSKYILDFIPPLTLVWLRFIIAFVVLYFILKIAEKKQKKKATIRKKDWLLFAWIGFIGYFISITCQFIGTKLSDAHTGSLVTSATPAFMVIFAALILKEKLTARRLLSTVIATIGVIIVIGWDIEIGSYFIGTVNTYVILGVLYLGIVSTAGAFFLWNKGLELLDASIGSLFFFFQPIVGSLLGWLLLNETLNSNFFIGGILIICSVLITTFEKK